MLIPGINKKGTPSQRGQRGSTEAVKIRFLGARGTQGINPINIPSRPGVMVTCGNIRGTRGIAIRITIRFIPGEGRDILLRTVIILQKRTKIP